MHLPDRVCIRKAGDANSNWQMSQQYPLSCDTFLSGLFPPSASLLTESAFGSSVVATFIYGRLCEHIFSSDITDMCSTACKYICIMLKYSANRFSMSDTQPHMTTSAKDCNNLTIWNNSGTDVTNVSCWEGHLEQVLRSPRSHSRSLWSMC